MNKFFLSLLVQLIIALALLFSYADNAAAQSAAPPSQDGITHYGLPIDEVERTYRKEDAVLEIVYSKMLSDDNMDKYVKRFYDEFLRQVEKWIYANTLPAKNMRIVISNCKFCRIGYCKKKNSKEISIVSFKENKKDRNITFKHKDIIDRSNYENVARGAMLHLLEK